MIHLTIQPKERNIYFPGCQYVGCNNRLDCADPLHRFDGRDSRILYAGETDRNAAKQIKWAAEQYDGCKLLRAMWPSCVWESSSKESPKWSAEAIEIPRPSKFPEGTIESIGVGGAVTGRHYSVLIKDDIATLRAANSRTVMIDTIEWNRATRALMDDPDESLEFMLGTRWAPGDVWETIQREDPSVECLVRSIIEDGKPIFPELFSLETIQRLKEEEKHLFPLIRMNSGSDPEISDFDVTKLRSFAFENGHISFPDDGRDQRLSAMYGAHDINLPLGTHLGPKELVELLNSGVRLKTS